MRWEPLAPNQSELAQFVIDQCRSPELTEILNSAKDELPTLTNRPVFDSYASLNRRHVYAQVDALYRALFRHTPELVWTTDPKDRFNSPMKQFVRDAQECFSAREADCIDIVVMMAALLIKVGLNPLIAVVGPAESALPTHAILGYWLEDEFASDIKSAPQNIFAHIENLSFLEATGVLRGNKKPFVDASAESLAALPRDIRDKVTLRVDMESQAAELLSARNARVFYFLDIRKYLLSIGQAFPVLAVMGAKGGVGKTTITARMAELLAETGANVLIIDFDIENAGSTFFHRARSRRALPTVKTVYDFFIAYSKPSYSQTPPDDQFGVGSALWRVTPPYLKQRNLGDVYLLPARSERLTTGTWEVIADIPASGRDATIRKEVNNIIQNAQMVVENLGAVIIDCGAGNNPIYSAAFDRARYGYVIAIPDPISFQNISDIFHEHRARYPHSDFRKIQIIVNRAPKGKEDLERIAAGWISQHPIGFIPDEPWLQKHYFEGLLDFDLGYDDFSLAILTILSKTLVGADARLLPDETDIWVRPWMDQVVTRRLPQRILRSFSFKLRTIMSVSISILAVALFFFLSSILFGTNIFRARVNSYFMRSTIAVIQTDSAAGAGLALERAQKGEDFAALAISLSTDNRTRSVGGRIDEQVAAGSDFVSGIGELANLDQCVAHLPAGYVCNRVLTSNGKYYVVKVLDKVSGVRVLAAAVYLFCLPALFLSIAWLRRQLRRRGLLLELQQRGTDKKWLRQLLRPPEELSLEEERLVRLGAKKHVAWMKTSAQREGLRWLRDLLQKAILDHQEAERQDRSGVSIVTGPKR